MTDGKLTVLDLFSGIGGFSLGLERTGGFRTVMFCEIDTYCRAVLAKHWPDVPVHDDIRTLAGTVADAHGGGFGGSLPIPESPSGRLETTAERTGIDVICGGFPCQPFSVAGKRRGAADDRHLWPEMLRVIQAVRPAWVIGENVAGLIPMGLDSVLSDLEASGYACQAFVVPACAVDAPHRRDRVWIVANAAKLLGNGRDNHARSGGESPREVSQLGNSGGDDRWRWQPEPQLGRVAHGIPRRVDRLRALGNSVVPQVVQKIGEAILKAEGLA